MGELQFQNQYRFQPKEHTTLILKSRDNDLLEVDEDVAFECLTIQAMSKQLGPKTDPPVRVFMVPLSTKLLRSIVDYCKFQVEWREYVHDNPSESQKAKLKAWDSQYEKLDFNSICDLLLAASYMDVPAMAKMLSKLAAGKMPKGAKETHKDVKGSNKISIEVYKKGVLRDRATLPYLPRCIQNMTKLMLRVGGFRKSSPVQFC